MPKIYKMKKIERPSSYMDSKIEKVQKRLINNRMLSLSTTNALIVKATPMLINQPY